MNSISCHYAFIVICAQAKFILNVCHNLVIVNSKTGILRLIFDPVVSPRLFKAGIEPPSLRALLTTSGNHLKGLPDTYFIILWIAVTSKPWVRYHFSGGVYSKIFFALVTPSNFLVPFRVFLPVSFWNCLMCSGTSSSGTLQQTMVKTLQISL